MEHFECTNTECNAYMRDNQCMWRYGDNISSYFKTCPHILELLSKENDRSGRMEKDINEPIKSMLDRAYNKAIEDVIEHLEEVENAIVEKRNSVTSQTLVGMQMAVEDTLGWLKDQRK